jgi:AcrR family transcriptional regulator
MPRAKNAAATRQAIFASARKRFLQESYDNVGLREIAADAGVDVALVNRYFGSKETLFKEVLRGCEESGLPEEIATADLPAYFASMLLRQDAEESRGHVETMMIILRSASSPKAAAIVRDALREDILEPLSARLEGDHADARASLSVAVWMGTTIMQTLMAVEPLCDKDCGMVDAKLVQLFEAALAPSN